MDNENGNNPIYISFIHLDKPMDYGQSHDKVHQGLFFTTSSEVI